MSSFRAFSSLNISPYFKSSKSSAGRVLKDARQARNFLLQSRTGRNPRQIRHESSVKSGAQDTSLAENYCLKMLRQYDTPSHILLRFIPPHLTRSYLAIRAFNIELARVADLVSNPTIATMRMRFWKDAIQSAYSGQPPAEPVAQLLASIIPQQRLNPAWFQRVITARESNAINPQFRDLAALESYAENTYSTLLYLTLSAFPLTSITLDHLASHIGKATGIVAILRGLPILAFPAPGAHHHPNPTLPPSPTRPGTISLPLATMSATGVREQDIYRSGPQAPGLQDAVFQVATRASDHLITARTMLASIQRGETIDHAYEHENERKAEYAAVAAAAAADPHNQAVMGGEGKVEKGGIPGFAVLMGPAVAAQCWLDSLQKVDFDVFHPRLQRPEWKLPWLYWRSQRRGMF